MATERDIQHNYTNKTCLLEGYSECSLIWKDLWNIGIDKFYINPRVKVVYNLQNWYDMMFKNPIINMYAYYPFHLLFDNIVAMETQIQTQDKLCIQLEKTKKEECILTPPKEIECYFDDQLHKIAMWFYDVTKEEYTQMWKSFIKILVICGLLLFIQLDKK